MTPTSPPAESRGAVGGPAGVDRRTEYRRKFIERTLRARSDELARRMLAAEWHYLAALLPVPVERAHVLDLACGSGLHSLAWAERGARVTGVDFDHDLLVASRERLCRAQPKVPPPGWVGGDATRLPLRGESFDVVFCNSLLEHVPDWSKVVAEAARVLRPGGLFVVYTTNRACPMQAEVNHFPFYSWLPDPVQRRVLAWIMEHRRDLVNFTDFPAVNWFTFPAMSAAFRRHGLEPFARVDLIARGNPGGAKGALVRAMRAMPVLKWPYYLYAISMGLYGVKRAG